MTLSKAILYVAGAIFVGIGVLFTARPETLVVFHDNPFATADARTEIRAVYGGIELAIGIFFGMAAGNDALRRAGLLLAALVSAGAGVARFLGVVLEGESGSLHFLWGGLEVVGGIVAFYALYREQGEDEDEAEDADA